MNGSNVETGLIRPVILCGGSGTRLWPMSREAYPKQFLNLFSERSLLQQTALRLNAQDYAAPILIGSEDQRFFMKRQLEQAGITPDAILLEPAGRNTAAAIALGCAWADTFGVNDILLFLPSDHLVGDVGAFKDAIRAAERAASEGHIVTFGVKPNEPNTQYGYIEVTPNEGPERAVSPVRRFIEKPPKEEAASFIRRGHFYWNAGIFMGNSSTFLEQLSIFLPATLKAVQAAVREGKQDGIFFRPAEAPFATLESISFDHAVMEKTSIASAIPVDMGWSDVGSWSSVFQLSSIDESANATSGKIVSVDTRNSLLRSEEGPLIAALGLRDTIVIAMRDAVLVAPADRAADLKLLTDEIRKRGGTELSLPARVARPWGSYEGIANGPRYQVKHLIVAPGEVLSLQMHYHRSEHWVVVRGSAEVTVGNEVCVLQENESTFIPAGTQHRLSNPGKVPLEIVEVQCGPYLGEDDIVRFEDQYGRH